jgi:opacity protein-like surface antigen
MTSSGLRGFARAAQRSLYAAGLAAVGLAAAGPGEAADLAKAPIVKAPYNWSGCYAGGYFGWGVANDWNVTDVNNFAANGLGVGAISPWLYSLNSSPLGGGYFGCNWQPWAGSGPVFGIDAEGGYLSLSGPGNQQLFSGAAGPITDFSKTSSGYGLVAGRLGWVFYERIHVYGKVGVAFYDTTSTINDGALAGSPAIATATKSQTPLAFGGGAEYTLTDHWIGKAEYLVFERGSSYTAVGFGPGAGFVWNERPSAIQTFKLGAAYKFW